MKFWIVTLKLDFELPKVIKEPGWSIGETFVAKQGAVEERGRLVAPILANIQKFVDDNNLEAKIPITSSGRLTVIHCDEETIKKIATHPNIESYSENRPMGLIL